MGRHFTRNTTREAKAFGKNRKMHGLQGRRRSSGVGRHFRFDHKIRVKGRGVKNCKLARKKQGQTKVTHWVASTLTSISNLLAVGLRSELQRPGEPSPHRGSSFERFRAAGVMPTACAAPAAFTPDNVARCCLCWG